MKKIVFLIITITLCTKVNSQAIKPAFSVTYIEGSEVADPQAKYKETTFNFNVAYSLTKRHNIGIQYLSINTLGSSYNFSQDRNSYYIAGMFYQYDLSKNSKNELYPELSINYGNYCTCGSTDPFEKAGLVYLGYGFGYDINLYKKLYLDLGFHVYSPVFNVTKEDLFYSFTQYIIGVSYVFN